MMRDINERVGHYLFSLAVIYSLASLLATVALALLGLPNAMMWGVLHGRGLVRAVRRAAGGDRPGGAGGAADLRGLAAHRRGAGHPDR